MYAKNLKLMPIAQSREKQGRAKKKANHAIRMLLTYRENATVTRCLKTA